MLNGEYTYFFTRVDFESGLESAPGPSTTIDVTFGFAMDVTYGNPITPNDAENSTYFLRLYRSERNSRPGRPPMFLLDTRSPFAIVAGTFRDGNDGIDGLLYGFPQLYEGPQTMVNLIPPPDCDITTFKVTHYENWGYRTHDRLRIKMGEDNQVIELVKFYVLGSVQLAGKSAKDHKDWVFSFRRQLQYLTAESRKPGTADTGDADVYINYNDADKKSGDWIDKCPGGGW